MGMPPMPHQQYVWDVALEIDEKTGLFAYSDVTFVGPRQVSGKTQQIEPVMIHRCTGIGHELVEFARREYGLRVPEPGPQRVFFTAQTADDARNRWRKKHVAAIKASPFASMWAHPPTLTQNKEDMAWVNGSSWSPGSTTGKTGGTGDTIDLGVIDEAWSRPDNRTELGMRPAMMTRPWSQLWALSMVPGAARVPPDGWPWLKQRMIAGRQRVAADMRRGRAYFEFSAADKLEEINVGDPDVWWACMPGLGFTVPEQRIRDDYTAAVESGQIADFAAEYLGVFPTAQAAAWQVISREAWSALIAQPDFQLPIALGVDANRELSMASISMAAQVADKGDVYVELVDRRRGVNWLIGAVIALARNRQVCAVGIDRNGPLAGLIVPLMRAAIEENVDLTVEAPRGPEVNAACASFYMMTGETDDESGLQDTGRRIRHAGQAELDQSVGGVVKHMHAEKWSWHREESTADTGPLYAATLAVAAGEAQEWLGGAYDVMESLG
jgi:hypothetical protein